MEVLQLVFLDLLTVPLQISGLGIRCYSAFSYTTGDFANPTLIMVLAGNKADLEEKRKVGTELSEQLQGSSLVTGRKLGSPFRKLKSLLA
ncbi:uncharacterized protein LOC133718644 isoform X2 [Rosa rugosa]|uniref:uncharacterized protein LOC133718644 isoform X2 n=1 Tax=Rosa rugosa TaxID=74645 RepID=UPI002B41545C|nr:uncharacterized protein LOC133718644 isoform X2 [Rosa rugosa]